MEEQIWKCLESPPVHLTAAADYLIVYAVVSNLRVMKYIYYCTGSPSEHCFYNFNEVFPKVKEFK